MPNESNSQLAAAFKHSAGILGQARPRALSELLQLTLSGMEENSKIEKEDFAFWMSEATDWKTAADQAWRTENTEWLYICCANLATLIYKKVLVHPDLTNKLSPSEIDILQKRGRNVLQGVAGLKKRVDERYAHWKAAERVRMQEYRRDIVVLHTQLSMEGGGDKPLPSVPEPERSLVGQFNFAMTAAAIVVAAGLLLKSVATCWCWWP